MELRYLAYALMSVVLLIHVYIVWLEMFAWTTRGPRVFRQFPKELFEPTKTLAANQGLYNGFLVAGLVWSLTIGQWEWQRNVGLFFLSCVMVAGLYGAATSSRRILWVQTGPALLAAVALWLAH